MVFGKANTRSLSETAVLMVLQVLNQIARSMKLKIVNTEMPNTSEVPEVQLSKSTARSMFPTGMILPELLEYEDQFKKKNLMWSTTLKMNRDSAEHEVTYICQDHVKDYVENRVNELFYLVECKIKHRMPAIEPSEGMQEIVDRMRDPVYIIAPDTRRVIFEPIFLEEYSDTEKTQVESIILTLMTTPNVTWKVKNAMIRAIAGRFCIELPDEVKTELAEGCSEEELIKKQYHNLSEETTTGTGTSCGSAESTVKVKRIWIKKEF